MIDTQLDNTTIFQSKEYKKSRKAYVGQCTFEYFVNILIGDAFLAKLLSEIGISDSLIGIISSFITLAFLFQLFAVFFVAKIKKTKRTIIIFSTMSQLLFMGLYLIPFMPFAVKYKTVLVVATVLIAYFCNYFVTSMIFKWGNSFVEPKKRGSFSATKEMISLVSGILFSIVVGKVVDSFENMNNLNGGFLFCAICIFILSLSNLISLLLMKSSAKENKSEEKVKFKDVIKNTFGNKSFRYVIILNVMWDVARYFTIGFLGIYKTKDLLLSVGTVQIINLFGNFARFLLSKPLGMYSDKHTFANGIKLALMIASVGFLVNVFCTPSTWWCIIIYTVMYNASLAGTNANIMNITYSYVDTKYFVQASAIKNSIGGICGFLASVVGSRIVSHIQANQNMIFGIHIYAQQLLSLISFVIIMLLILFIHFVVSKRETVLR